METTLFNPQGNGKYKIDKDEAITHNGCTLYRVIALCDIGDRAKAGDKGGYIECENNLSTIGDAWVCGNARVYGDAHVFGGAYISDNATVYDHARIYGNTKIDGNAAVFGYVRLSGDVCVSHDAEISDKTKVCWFGSFGSAGRTTTAFIEKSGEWRVNCGCFSGTISEFREKVKKTHGYSPIAQEYLAIADLIELRAKRIKTEQEEDNE